MQEYRFIAWADSHWDKLGAKCITNEDLDNVERAIFKRAAEQNMDFTFFLGDRFLKREPDDETKVRADRVMYDLVHAGKIPHYHLIGNHDWVDNTRKWHTAESLKLYNNITVMDVPRTYRFRDVCIHALPADFPFDESYYNFDKNCLNLFAFHDAITGCYLNDDKTTTFDGGLSLGSIDLPQFDFVFAGDIHVRQKLPFKNTQGGYLGSVVQRTKADSNILRGWTEVHAFRETQRSKWEFKLRFCPTRNFFSKLSFRVNEKTTFEDLVVPYEKSIQQLLEIKLTGEKVDVDRIADDDRWKELEKKLDCRRIDIIRAYATSQTNVVVDLTSSNGIFDDLQLYLGSNFASLEGIDSNKILDTVRNMKKDV